MDEDYKKKSMKEVVRPREYSPGDMETFLINRGRLHEERTRIENELFSLEHEVKTFLMESGKDCFLKVDWTRIANTIDRRKW